MYIRYIKPSMSRALRIWKAISAKCRVNLKKQYSLNAEQISQNRKMFWKYHKLYTMSIIVFLLKLRLGKNLWSISQNNFKNIFCNYNNKKSRLLQTFFLVLLYVYVLSRYAYTRKNRRAASNLTVYDNASLCAIRCVGV